MDGLLDGFSFFFSLRFCFSSMPHRMGKAANRYMAGQAVKSWSTDWFCASDTTFWEGAYLEKSSDEKTSVGESLVM